MLAKFHTNFTKNKKRRNKKKNDRKAEKNKNFCLFFGQQVLQKKIIIDMINKNEIICKFMYKL